MKVSIIIAVYNEARTVATLLERVWAQPLQQPKELVIVESNSSDGSREIVTEFVAQHANEGPTRIRLILEDEPRGKGHAIRNGLAAATGDILLIQDADLEYDVGDYPDLIRPIAEGRADFTIGSRVLPGAHVERGALSPQARAGNLVATTLIRVLYGARHSDLGPFRAIRLDAREALEMRDLDWGWTAEMQVKAIRKGLRIVEVPTSWRRRRGGRSKISGTVRGVLGAGYKILTTIARHAIG